MEVFDQIKKLYGNKFKKIYGPYIRKKDKRKILVLYDGNKRITIQYSRILLEIKLGRLLNNNEEVDHKDGNCQNDNLNNIQLLTITENRKKQMIQTYGEPIKIYCENCRTYIKQIYKKRSTQKYYFCSNKCRTDYYGANQYGNKIVGYSVK